MFRQVPPSSLSFSMIAVLSPSWPARMAATYPPGPEPMIATSNGGCSFKSSPYQSQRRGTEHKRHKRHKRHYVFCFFLCLLCSVPSSEDVEVFLMKQRLRLHG